MTLALKFEDATENQIDQECTTAYGTDVERLWSRDYGEDHSEDDTVA